MNVSTVNIPPVTVHSFTSGNGNGMLLLESSVMSLQLCAYVHTNTDPSNLEVLVVFDPIP
jgi:hypothetical protein